MADRAKHVGYVFFIHQGFLLDFKQIGLSLGGVGRVVGAAVVRNHCFLLKYDNSKYTLVLT
jgi:hypothetical protein